MNDAEALWTMDTVAALAVVVAGAWLLGWNARRGRACASCPATADVRKVVAIAAAARPPVRRTADQVALGRAWPPASTDRAAAAASSSDLPDS